MTVGIEGEDGLASIQPHVADFDAVLLDDLSWKVGEGSRSLPDWVRRLADAGTSVLLDVDLGRFDLDHPLVRENPNLFTVRRRRQEHPVDPRRPAPAAGEARARLKAPEADERVLPAIAEDLVELLQSGVAGFRVRRPGDASPLLLKALHRRLAECKAKLGWIAHTPGESRETVSRLVHCGFDHTVSSLSHWDNALPWLAEEYEALRLIAPVLAGLHADAAEGHAAARLLMLAAATGDGLLAPARLLAAADADLSPIFGLSEVAARFGGEMRQVGAAGGNVTALLRTDAPDARQASEAMLLLINRSTAGAAVADPAHILPYIGADFQAFKNVTGSGPAFGLLNGGEIRVLVAGRARPVAARSVGKASMARDAAAAPRLIIEAVEPDADGGAFPVKRTVGDRVTVQADIFADGHEKLAAEVRWRAADERTWHSTPMEELPNDRWTAAFPLERMGRHEFEVHAWLDRYGGFRRDFAKKLDAGVAEKVDFMEGRAFIEQARERATGKARERLDAALRRLDSAAGRKAEAAILLDEAVCQLMEATDDRPHAVASGIRLVESERLAARFSSWYELFPRSQTTDADRHGTFDDVIARLPDIRAMGFDTLYFPPIHPIGRANRKGRNNSLEPGPDDPGSPYAIGSPEGGHDAIHPELGGLEDFRRLIDAARRHGLELALDFAIQCSPDHPWLKEHPGWFDWRPDGTIKYAENPPKKYQDIVNVDFYKEESIPGLWIALRDVVMFWAAEGVKSFRVDNPHTKPYPFWEWMIREVRGVHPDAIFLSEAFTRPKRMYRLAKVGFSQSYTYFTWRNSKDELTEYFTELATTAPKEFFRPHLFVNTPDINPPFLHDSGPAGFKIRAALAATLSGLFGIYSGFELCESEPLPGKEEYKDSEKYEVKSRDWKRPGNIIADITLLNRLRRAYPALQTHLGVRFYNAWNDNIIYYGKPAPDWSEMILVAVNLDPHNPHEADFEIPLWEWGLQDHDHVNVEDLVFGHRFAWHGKRQHMRLAPDQPYAIWRIAPPGETS